MDNDDLEKYQVKSVTPVDKYECTLSDELKEIARSELNETDEIREKSMKELRDWVLNNPRIVKTRLDSIFILRFLRYAKYDMKKAKNSFEQFMIMFYTGFYKFRWFHLNFNVNEFHLKEILMNGFNVFLPRKDLDKCKVCIARLAAFNPKIPDIIHEVITLQIALTEIMCEDEETQIRGSVLIVDCRGASLRHAFLLSVSTWYKLLSNIEKCFSGRVRAIHIINLPSPVRFIAKIVLSNISEKLKSRIYLHKTVKEMISCEALKGLELPHEYSGNLSYEMLCKKMVNLMNDNHNFLKRYFDMKINENLYPDDVLELNVQCLDKTIEDLCNEKMKMMMEKDDKAQK